jgi:flagellar biosynthesis protein FlhA
LKKRFSRRGAERKRGIRKMKSGLLCFSIIVLVALIVFPIPALLLDILIAVNLILALLIFLIAFKVKKVNDFSLCPMALLFSTVFGLIVNISATRLILTKGAAFDGQFIRTVASLVSGEGIESLVVGLIIFIVLTVLQILMSSRIRVRTSEVSALSSLTRDADILREKDFCDNLDGASKFISGNVKIYIIIPIITILVGTLINANIHAETNIDAAIIYIPFETTSAAVKTFLPFAISNGFFSMLPSFFHFLTIRCLIKSISVWKNRKKVVVIA